MNIKVLYLILFALISSQLFAQENTKDNRNIVLTSDFQIGVGFFFPNQNIKFSASGESESQEISFGNSFDFGSSLTRPQFYADWRFSRNNKWKVSAEYFDANFTEGLTLSEDIEIGDGDYTFTAGSNVELGYNLNLYRVYVGYTISRGEKHDLGGGIGFHIATIEPFIQGNVIINDNDNTFRRANTNVTAPLPNIALYYTFAPTTKWSFNARFDWFGITIDKYSGSLWDLGPSVRYQVYKNISIQADYRYFKIDFDLKDNNWRGGFDMSYSGPTIALFANF